MKGYLVIALRRLKRQWLFSLINITGLTTGITAAILILHFVHFEKSYDTFNSRYDGIFRLRLERTSESGEAVRFASCTPPAGLRIRALFPEVDLVARILRYKGTISKENILHYEERIFFAEPQFLQMFNYEIIAGATYKELGEQGSMFITESTALKYFGNSNPIGQSLVLDGKMIFRVAGILKDPPENSHIKFDFLVSWPDIEVMYSPAFEQSWGQTGVFTYVTFVPGADIDSFEEKLSGIVESEFGEALEYYKVTMDLPLQPLKDIHLDSNYMQEYEVNGDKTRVAALFIVALFIIVIAWVNYIVLSTAQSGSRMPETGMRKIAGASRKQVISHLLVETLILNSISLLLAVAAVILVTPSYETLTGVPAEGMLKDPFIILWFFGFFLGGLVIAGTYPVLVHSSATPSMVLKGKQSTARSNIFIRKMLVVFQNFISMVIISGTLVIYLQDRFLQTADTGIDLQNIIVIKAPRIRTGSYPSTLKSFIDRVEQLMGVSATASVTEVPGRQLYWDAGGIFRTGSDQSKNYQIIGADYNYLDIFRIDLISGRNFSNDYPTDSTALILNKKAVSWMGFLSPDEAIGKEVNYWGEIFHIIGVTADFHQQSARFEVEPTLIRFLPEGQNLMGNIVLKTGGGGYNELISNVSDIYSEYFPGNSFDYFLADDYYNQQFRQDRILGKVFTVFSLITILITVLGVIGLAVYLVDQQKKDISIRKVMGDSPTGIVVLFSRTFLELIILASLFSIPVSWIVLSRWMSTFASHIRLNIIMFLIPLFFTLLYTGLTVMLIVLKESHTNPVNNLRYE